jgi:sugar lactone lactonase YvrE
VRKWLSFVVILLLSVLAGYLLFWPVPIDPVAWTPPVPPARTGVLAPNEDLATIERIAERIGTGPEDPAFGADGTIYSGFADGRIIRVMPNGLVRNFANTGGRPLGMDFAPDGSLIVADAEKGLLSISPDAKITVLATEEGGVPFRFTDDVKVAKDGTIYFSDASSKFGRYQYYEDIVEHRGNGRLLVYHPSGKRVECLIRDLRFANGVALSPDESFVLVNETGKYRVMRFWLAGEKKGQTDVFIENLPGLPDNISCNGKDTFWLALFSPRNAALDATLPRPFLRKMIYRLPKFMQPAPAHHAMIAALSLDGKIARLYEDSTPNYAPITSVEERGPFLYLGSLEADALARWALPRKEAPPAAAAAN